MIASPLQFIAARADPVTRKQIMKIHAVTIDTTNPQKLAAWWSKALGMAIGNDYGQIVQLAASPHQGAGKLHRICSSLPDWPRSDRSPDRFPMACTEYRYRACLRASSPRHRYVWQLCTSARAWNGVDLSLACSALFLSAAMLGFV